jgi:hypothetical protein
LLSAGHGFNTSGAPGAAWKRSPRWRGAPLNTDAEVVQVASKGISRSVQRQVDLATAVCQERLLATHVRHSLAIVDLVSDSLPFDDALDIYVRIMRLNAEQARNVGSRALAELGRRSGLPAPPDIELEAVLKREEELQAEEFDEAAEADVEGRSGAMFSRLRRRLQGRVHADLRERINLAAARTEDDLFTAHVENALTFVKTVGDEMSAPAAVDLYLDTMVLPEGLGDVVYNRALRLIADKVLPATGNDRRNDSAPAADKDGVAVERSEVRS